MSSAEGSYKVVKPKLPLGKFPFPLVLHLGLEPLVTLPESWYEDSQIVASGPASTVTCGVISRVNVSVADETQGLFP